MLHSEQCVNEMMLFFHRFIVHPDMYFSRPEGAEAAIEMLAAAIVAHQRNTGFVDAWKLFRAERALLTSAVVRPSGRYVALCDEQVLPESVVSFEILCQRASQLADKIIVGWRDASEIERQ